MTKTDKKRDKQLRELLTQVCESHCKSIAGFSWLTHRIDWKSPHKTFTLTVVFEHPDDLATFIQSNDRAALERLVKNKIKALGVDIKEPRQFIYQSQ
ncbi:hypothetical protein AAEU32_01670 [Pseudoalteromonas sp. SSDWG2]|uniref:hypothetical protein n=1 Tax=Pseudoalteromonas sp. SSDWG2 TaxID=3139391 RepID=UPI003BAD4A9B